MFAASKTDGSSELPDPQFNYVTMLLHGDGTNGAQNNTFLDSSSNNFTITRNGNTTQGSFSPYGSNWSNFFNASGASLSTPTNTALDFGTGDFTVEFWLFPTILTFNIFLSAPNNGQTQIGYDSTSDIRYLYFYNGANIIRDTTNASLTSNQWNHVVLSRSGTTLSLFTNGVRRGTATYSSAISFSTCTIGGYYLGGLDTSGYMSNLRIVKGTAVYNPTQTTYTVPTAPLTAISGTSLLTCADNRFIDDSTNNFAITVNGTPSVQRFNPFGTSTAYSTSVIGGSGYFDGNGDYITTPTNTAFSFGTGDFTISTWIYTGVDTLSPAGYSRSPFTLGNVMGYLRINAYHGGVTGAFRALVDGNTICDGSTVKLSDSAWHNITIVRESGNVRHWIDGVYVGTIAYSTNINNTVINGIGGDTRGPDGNWNGYIAGTYVNKGTALFTGTSNITVPTTPPTSSSGNSLLVNFTNGAIFDNAMMNDLETVGNAQISTSVVKYGTGSMYFDGTGDNLFTRTTPDLALGTGDFTVEFWINLAANLVSFAKIIQMGTTGDAFTIETQSTTNVLTVTNFTSTVYLVSNTALTNNTWIHVAVTRASGTLRIFQNGLSVGGVSNTINFLNSGGVYIGQSSLGTAMNGYIDDLRITKGYARYTANFTPPTAAFSNTGPY
jgi:hypothetical protein